MLISIPRLIKKDEEVHDGLKYLNMEEKIQEYLSRQLALNLCFLFKPRKRSEGALSVSSDTFLMNYTEDIIAEVAAVRQNDALVKVIDKKFFETYNGRIALKVVSLGEETENGIQVNKIVRFEAAILKKGES